jgi:hypothetical protein
MPLNRNAHCGLVVGDTGKERYSRIILHDNNLLIEVYATLRVGDTLVPLIFMSKVTHF